MFLYVFFAWKFPIFFSGTRFLDRDGSGIWVSYFLLFKKKFDFIFFGSSWWVVRAYRRKKAKKNLDLKKYLRKAKTNWIKKMDKIFNRVAQFQQIRTGFVVGLDESRFGLDFAVFTGFYRVFFLGRSQERDWLSSIRVVADSKPSLIDRI